jgi:hypothetical protein
VMAVCCLLSAVYLPGGFSYLYQLYCGVTPRFHIRNE